MQASIQLPSHWPGTALDRLRTRARHRVAFSGRALAALALLAACSSRSATPEQQQPRIPELSAGELRDAPTTLRIRGVRLELETRMTRNFQPTVGNPPFSGRFVNTTVTVSEHDLRAIPADLDMRWVWMLDGDDVVSGALPESGHDAAQPFEQIKGWACCPDLRADWGQPSLDVVVGLVDAGGTLHLLRAAEQRILLLF